MSTDVRFKMSQFLLVVVIIALLIVGIAVRMRHRSIQLNEHLIKMIALSIMLISAGFFTLFVVGEIMADPGGVESAIMAAIFLIPLLTLSFIAWRSPKVSRMVLAIATVAVVTFDIWTAVTFDTWREFEDRNGPIVTIAILVIEIPLAVHAYYRDTRLTSLTLIYLGLVPPILRAIALGDFDSGALQRMLTMSGFSPTLLVGVLFLWSSFLGNGRVGRRAGSSLST